MQDLSLRVQKIASSFYETRSNKAFTEFYNVLLPEANKMLRAFVKDSQTIEDISSKIFETILTKPSIFFNTQTQDEFLQIAAGYFGVEKNCCRLFTGQVQIQSCIEGGVVAAEDEDAGRKIKSYYAPDMESAERMRRCHTGGIAYSDMGKLWLLIFQPGKHKLYRKDENGERINLEADAKKPAKHIELKVTLDSLKDFDLTQLSDIQTPFVFDLEKPYLHYFSRIVKTNALSHLKKNKRLQDQQFADMYSGYDDDDKPQLIANQLSSEPERVERERSEHQEQLDNQKFMIIFDIIQDSVPENQRGIMIDAILYKMDYKLIAEKYHLDTVGCIKSRVHRFRKLLDEKTSQTPHFTSQVTLGVYKTYFSGGRVRMAVDVCEPTDEGTTYSLWHGHYIEYYSTGEVKWIGRYYLNKRQGDWYQFYKSGAIMKRGHYQQGKPDGVWHHFDEDGKLNSKINHLTGYYEVHQENGEVVSGIKDSTILPVKEKKPSADETNASRLCIKHDSELTYPSLHFEIS